jgi:hypothetical protein
MLQKAWGDVPIGSAVDVRRPIRDGAPLALAAQYGSYAGESTWMTRLAIKSLVFAA